MKLTAPITVQALRAMKPGDELADGACPGLRARCREKGVVWSLVARDSDGIKKRFEIAAWPETGVPQARALAAEYKAAIRREKATPAKASLGTVIALYEQEGPALENKSWVGDGRGRIVSVFGGLLDMPSHKITPADLQRVADVHPSKTSAASAVRYLRPVLRWGEKRDYLPKGLADGIEQPTRIRRRDRVLSEQELAALLTTLGRTGHDGAVRMMLLTACRREEVCGMRFEDIIEDVWFIPGEMRKNGRALAVPLTVAAQTIIGAQGRTSGFVFLGSRGKPLANWNRWQKKIFERTGTSDWHRHDLRRTAATIMGENGVLPAIVEIAIGHAEPHSQLAGIYNKSRYPKEHADALQTLSDVLSGIEIRARSRADQ